MLLIWYFILSLIDEIIKKFVITPIHKKDMNIYVYVAAMGHRNATLRYNTSSYLGRNPEDNRKN